MVIALDSTGRPPRRPTGRATLRPCGPSGIAQPRTSSSTSAGFTCGTRASSAAMTWPASSSGRVCASVPLCARPTAERTASTITTFSIMALVPQRLVVHQHVLHALLGLRLAAEAHEGLALELEHLVLGDFVRAARDAAAQDLAELGRDLGVVCARLTGVDQRADHHLDGGHSALAR